MVQQTGITQAESHYRAGDYVAAIAILDAERAASPADPISISMLGLCKLRLGHTEDALALLREATTLAPHDPLVALRYGIGLQAVGRYRDAADVFRACQVGLPFDPAPSLNLATALLALGDVAEALRAARKARLRAPQMAEAHYTLGLAHLAADNLSAAAADFAEAARLSDRFAEPWVNLGLICYRSDDLIGAITAMRKALSIAPHHRAATTNLAVFLRLIGDAQESETLLTELLAREPDADEARVNLADVMLQEDRPHEALALLDRPLPAASALRQHWQMQRALGLLRLNRVSEAHEIIDALGPVKPAARSQLLWRRMLLADAEGKPALTRALAGEMQTVLGSDAPMLPEHRIIGNFELARYWQRVGDKAGAFRCWQRGHEILRRIQPFDRSRFAAFVDSTIAAFDHPRFQSGGRASNADQTPVFIVGMPRSGTTLTEQIIAAHRDVSAAGERTALMDTFRTLGGAADTATAVDRIVRLDRQELDGAAEDYLAELRASAPHAKRIVDKMPGNFRYLGLVGLMLPGARIINCKRDPRDTGLSIFTYRFYGAHPYAHDLADLGWYIAQERRLMAHWSAALPMPVLTIRLRDWVEDFPTTLRRVLAYLDLPYDKACERFYESDRTVRTVSRAQVREPINARGLDRWRAYASQLTPLIGALREHGLVRDGD